MKWIRGIFRKRSQRDWEFYRRNLEMNIERALKEDELKTAALTEYAPMITAYIRLRHRKIMLKNGVAGLSVKLRKENLERLNDLAKRAWGNDIGGSNRAGGMMFGMMFMEEGK